MNLLKIGITCVFSLAMLGCSPVKVPAANQYQLTAFSAKKATSRPHSSTLLVTTPEAVAAFQTEQMLYMKKPYQLEPFAKNAWISPPADMLYPLITQSLQATGYFHTVVSSPYNQGADYRLDTQLLNLKQNFMKRPSVLEFSVKVVLTRVSDNQALGSQIFIFNIPCSQETPYGGVIAANAATYQFTERLVQFVLSHIK